MEQMEKWQDFLLREEALLFMNEIGDNTMEQDLNCGICHLKFEHDEYKRLRNNIILLMAGKGKLNSKIFSKRFVKGF